MVERVGEGRHRLGPGLLRILHVIAEMAPGGAERVVISLTDGSANDVAVAAARGTLSGQLSCPQFDLPIVERRVRLVPVAVWRLRRAIRKWRPDVVHCHNPGMALVTRLAIVPWKRPRAVVTVHGLIADDYPRAARILRMTAMPIVACGPGVAEALVQQDLAVRTTIVNGIAPPPPPATRADVARDLGVPPERPLIVCAGRLVPLKNIDVVIRAVSAVPGAHLVVVGDGPDRGLLQALAAEVGVGDRVVFTGHRDDARGLIGAADVVVLASSSEGLPLIALEALAAGTPLVATDLPAVRELVRDETEALLVPPGDIDAVASAIRRVVEEPAVARRLSDAGPLIAAPFTEEAMVRAFDLLYEELVA